MADNLVNIEVAYALPEKQRIVDVIVPEGTVAVEAVKQSTIKDHFPDLDIDTAKLGIFGKAIKPATHVVEEGDRIEIYRPLKSDPKASRKARAEKKAKQDS